MMKQSFLLAAFFYLFNSLGNVGQSVFIKYFQHSTTMTMAQVIVVKSIVSAILMAPFRLKHIRHFPKNIGLVIVLATLYSADVLLCNSGMRTVPVNTGVFIMFLVPIWVVIFGRVLLGEKRFNVVNALTLLVCFGAIAYSVGGDAMNVHGFNFGYVLIFLDTIVIPLGLVLQKKFNDVRPVAYALFTNAVVLGLISFGMSGFSLPEATAGNAKAAVVVAFFDLMEFAGVYIAYKLTDVAFLQPIRFTRIIFSTILSYVILHEAPTHYQLVGMVIVIVANIFAVCYTHIFQEKKPAK